jgi:hypothetical protein
MLCLGIDLVIIPVCRKLVILVVFYYFFKYSFVQQGKENKHSQKNNRNMHRQKEEVPLFLGNCKQILMEEYSQSPSILIANQQMKEHLSRMYNGI